MPIPFFIVISFLFLSTPVYGIIILLFDKYHRPHQRSILALGGGLLLKIFMIFTLVSLGWLLSGNWLGWLPLLLILVAGFNVYQLMNEPALRHKNY